MAKRYSARGINNLLYLKDTYNLRNMTKPKDRSKEPSFPFYSADFLIGVAGMKDSDVGQYIKLLCLQHQKGHLTREQYRTMSPRMNFTVLEKFRVDEEGKYYNPVLDQVLARREKFREKQSQNAANSAAKTLPEVLPECLQDNANGTAKVTPLENEYINIISNYRRIIPPSKTVVGLYCKMRKNKIDPDYFVDYYNARGWVYGKQKTAIVDWQAVIRTWERTEIQKGGKTESGLTLRDMINERDKFRS